jgi:hypothetical protein
VHFGASEFTSPLVEHLQQMVRDAGIEPATYGSEDRFSVGEQLKKMNTIREMGWI